ncbi:MAG TPA: trypsin-like peptidase domain-containing protein [Mycobacteriales bacterium]|nr:trypsin-like peptidase domain-containing protein [Mycobacteriales bacterium]
MDHEPSGSDAGACDVHRVAEVISTRGDSSAHQTSESRGSGYRVTATAVLTAAHVVADAVSVSVRFDADQPAEWAVEAQVCWRDERSDLAVLAIPAVGGGVDPVRYGRLGERAAVVAVHAAGFPRWKLRRYDDAAAASASAVAAGSDVAVYRDLHDAHGSATVLSNRREGTLEVTVPPPAPDPDPAVSPWEGMSGATVWVGDHIVGVLAKHHPNDGLSRLAAARVGRCLDRLAADERARLGELLGLPVNELPDVVPRPAGYLVRSAYREQVRDIAPYDGLRDREEELAELTRFCAGDTPYLWWQAGPWAGKSALMSSFVLEPPAGVDVVSFFVTGRLAGQADSDAFTSALLDQLAALRNEDVSPLLAQPAARDAHRRRLLREAAEAAQRAGRRLVLVVDGLDEDINTVPGPGTNSIASLLPRRTPDGLRVIVASRPHPPIPLDVDLDHPLRTCHRRWLDDSPHARAIAPQAKQELSKLLLAGETLQRDVLGSSPPLLVV